MLKTIVITALALSATALSAADEASTTAPAGFQPGKLKSSVADATDDSMVDFLAVVADELADKDGADDTAAEIDPGDGVAAATTSEAPRLAGRGHQKHLGVGFGHGVSNRDGNSQVKPGYNGTAHITRNTVSCNGNGHPRDPGTGNGYDLPATGSALGVPDCSALDPSPSD